MLAECNPAVHNIAMLIELLFIAYIKRQLPPAKFLFLESLDKGSSNKLLDILRAAIRVLEDNSRAYIDSLRFRSIPNSNNSFA
jgi:hypothetical protein